MATPGAARAALHLAGHLGRILLGGVLLWAGLLKGLDPAGFAQEVAAYGIVWGWPATLFAFALIPFEVVLGAALLLNFRPVLSLALGTGLIAVFMGAIGFALATGRELQSCGCFGSNTPRTPQQTLAEDAGLLAAGLIGLAAARRIGPGGERGRRRWKGALLAGTSLASCAFVVASPHLPLDGLATALRPGVSWESLGVAVAEVDLARGAHLVAVMGMRDDASSRAVGPLNELAASGRVAVVGLYADDTAAYNEFFWSHGPGFPLYHASPTDLRRLHRKLPRCFALKQGVVVATWEQPPAPGEVEEALR